MDIKTDETIMITITLQEYRFLVSDNMRLSEYTIRCNDKIVELSNQLDHVIKK